MCISYSRLMILQTFSTTRETCLITLNITYISNICPHDRNTRQDANQSTFHFVLMSLKSKSTIFQVMSRKTESFMVIDSTPK
jgi:hypothetical protein